MMQESQCTCGTAASYEKSRGKQKSRRFWRALKDDYIDMLRKEFGPDWMFPLPRKGEDGNLTRVGNEVEAIKNLCGILQTMKASWFEYNSGSRIYHFRFPLRYQKIARDGVSIFSRNLVRQLCTRNPASLILRSETRSVPRLKGHQALLHGPNWDQAKIAYEVL